MSSLENTITEVMSEEAAKLPKGGADVSPADVGSDKDAEKKASELAKAAGDSTKEAPKTNASPSGDSMEVVSDGETKVEKGKAVNQEETESEESFSLDNEADSEEDFSLDDETDSEESFSLNDEESEESFRTFRRR